MDMSIVRVVAEERDGDAQGSMTVFTQCILLHRGDGIWGINRWSLRALLEHWSWSTKEQRLCKANMQRLVASSTKDMLLHLQLPTLTIAVSCKGENTRRGLVSPLHYRQTCSSLLSQFKNIDLMYCTALRNWEIVTSHHRKSSLLKW